MESAGRVGVRQGMVSELTMIFPFAPGGARRLRAFLQLLNGNLDGANKVGSLHDMRFVFLDDDTKLLFCTAFDGEWDPYIDDFATKIPDYLDILDCALEGWPGIRSPEAKDYLASHQINAEGWYVAHPDLTVAEISRLKRVGEAVDEFLDNDTKLLFCTAFDGEWDPYIDDFATKIPDYLDILDCGLEGWPGIRSPEAKDYLASHQITAEGWYVANPDLTVAETKRLKTGGKAVDEFLDKIGD